MRLMRLVIIAIIATVILLSAQGVALQVSQKSTTVSGYVYRGAVPVDYADVTLRTWDGHNPGSVIKTTTTDETGKFTFRGVYFDPSNQLAYCVEATRYDESAYVLVYMVDSPTGVRVSPIKIDITDTSGYSDVAGAANIHKGSDMTLAMGANVTLFVRDPVNNTLNRMEIPGNPTKADGKGEFTFKSVPYGFYTVEVLKGNDGGKQDFVAYKQETSLSVVASPGYVPIATPTPVPPSWTPDSGLFGLSIPGFEAVAMLLAFMFVAYRMGKS